MNASIATDVPIRDRSRSIDERDADERSRALRILFLVSAHNGLSQRAWISLTELGHQVNVAVVDSAAEMESAVAEHQPELIVCPLLKKLIPETIWRRCPCLVVHPGPPGDRGPSSLDWAIELGASEWGVTVLLANAEFDAGEALAWRSFRMREAGKASLYRNEVRHAAVEAVADAVTRILAPAAGGDGRARPTAIGRARPLMPQSVRAIDWDSDSTETVLRKIRGGEGQPGVRDVLGGCEFYIFGAHRERTLQGRPGELVAQRHGAVCRATVDGAVWITHLSGATLPPAGTSSCPRRAHSSSPASSRGRQRSMFRSTARWATITPTARSRMNSTRGSVTWRSSSTTGR